MPVFFLNMVLYEFIRVDGGEVLASVSFIAGTVADCLLNFVLVLGVNLGVRGAILATVIWHTLSVTIYLLHFVQPDHILRFAHGPVDRKEILSSLRVGLAGSSRYLLQFVFLLAAIIKFTAVFWMIQPVTAFCGLSSAAIRMTSATSFRVLRLSVRNGKPA